MAAHTTLPLMCYCSDNDEELVSALSSHDNMVEIFQKMLRKNIINSDKKTLFYSLDHSRLDPELLARYLLRLVSERIRENKTVWRKFLNFLDQIGEREICDRLKKLSAAPAESQSECHTSEGDIILSLNDVSFLVNLMTPVLHKYDKVGLALNLPEYKIKQCTETNFAMKLSYILTSWISEDRHTPPSTTLSKLKEALRGDIVAEYQFSIDLEEKFIESKKNERLSFLDTCDGDSNPILDITEQSIDTEVEDGKSTLLHVLASPRESVCYQWQKDGQPLANDATYSGVTEDILVINGTRQGTEGEYTCCVSLQDKQMISNKINLEIVYTQEKKQLLDLYSVREEIPEDSWPPVGTKTFVNLVLVKSEKQTTDSKQYCISGNADKVTVKKEKVKYEDLFAEYQSGALIVIEGRPGSGKTTLVHKLVKEWSKGTILKNAKLVFLITLRSLNNAGSKDIMFGYLEEFIKNSGINKENGEESCIILDGLDEYKSEDTSSVVYSLLDKVCLPRAMIIVSSRPAAMNNIKNKLITKQVQTYGFKKNEIVEYVRSFPFGSDLESDRSYSSGLEKYLNDHPNVFHMCYLPVHTAMICYLYKHQRDKIPNTQTKIYQEFTLSMILRHLRRYSSDTNLSSLSQLTGDFKINFDTLCKLAFTMSARLVQVITRSELDDLPSYSSSSGDEWCLGLLTVHHTFKSHGEYNEYTFLHLTFQEFLTAYYISRLSKEEQLAAVQKNKDCSSAIWIFLCGLINFQDNDDLLLEILTHLDKNLIMYLSCAFESQQKMVCDTVLMALDGKFIFPSEITSFDIACVKYVTSNASKEITTLELPETNTIRLLQNINEKHFGVLKKLKLYESLSETNDLIIFGRILRLCTHQLGKIINLQLTRANHDGVQYVSDALKNLNLRFISMSCTSSGSILALLLGLKDHKSLHLNLKFEELCHRAIEELVTGLKTLSRNQLNLLIISDSEILRNDAVGISEIFQSQSRIATLKLSNNNINSVCKCIITSALQNLKFLKHLTLSYQLMDDKEVVKLVTQMKHLLFLGALDLSHNSIGPEGAAAFSKIFGNLPFLETIDLSHNSIGSGGANSIGAELSRLKNLKHLNVLHNNITVLDDKTKREISHLASSKTLFFFIEGADSEMVLRTLSNKGLVWTDYFVDVGPKDYVNHIILMDGLISGENEIAIADLVVAAIQNSSTEIILSLQPRLIVVHAKNNHTKFTQNYHTM